MFSQLPRSNSTHEEVSSTKARSFIPSRNLHDAPFKQFSKDGQIKREYMNHRSSRVNDIASHETKLLKYSSLQQQLTARNIDDIALDILEVKRQIEGEKEYIKNIQSKVDLVLHVLTNTSDLKNVATKTDKRLEVLEQMLSKVQKLKGKFALVISELVYQTILHTPP
jgi:vacuolar-type H+-ATPase subunit I/STV1